MPLSVKFPIASEMTRFGSEQFKPALVDFNKKTTIDHFTGKFFFLKDLSLLIFSYSTSCLVFGNNGYIRYVYILHIKQAI